MRRAVRLSEQGKVAEAFPLLTRSAKAGIAAIVRNIDEMDTDAMAVDVRANLQRDPKALERAMARMLGAKVISTGR